MIIAFYLACGVVALSLVVLILLCIHDNPKKVIEQFLECREMQKNEDSDKNILIQDHSADMQTDYFDKTSLLHDEITGSLEEEELQTCILSNEDMYAAPLQSELNYMQKLLDEEDRTCLLSERQEPLNLIGQFHDQDSLLKVQEDSDATCFLTADVLPEETPVIQNEDFTCFQGSYVDEEDRTCLLAEETCSLSERTGDINEDFFLNHDEENCPEEDSVEFPEEIFTSWESEATAELDDSSL